MTETDPRQGSTRNPPLVSILTPFHNDESTLAECLTALAALDLPSTMGQIEQILIDDGSRDGSVAVAEKFAAKHPDRVRLIRKEAGGEASALNAGWAKARGDFVAIIEGDVEVSAEWLSILLPILQEDASVMAAGGYLETPTEDAWIARLAGYEVERKLAGKSRETQHLTSANVLYRREAFDRAGPFDEKLINASLDSVFNARLIASGGKLIYEPRARVRHHFKPTFLGFLKRQYAYARYRIYNPSLELYPADRFLALHVALSGLALATLALGPLLALAQPQHARVLQLAGPALVLLALLALCPQALAMARQHRDATALLFPPVAFLRNLVGGFGYAIGVIAKAMEGPTKPQARPE